jgi:hypothetical protein
LAAALQAKSRGTQKHVGTIFYRTRSELFQLCPFMDIIVFRLADKPLVIVRSLASISKSFEFESHSTAYSSVIIAMLW